MKELVKESWMRSSRILSVGSRSAVKKLANFCVDNFVGAQQRAFDLLVGVSTKGVASTEASALEGCNHYEDCQWLSVRRALKKLDPNTSDVFVDLGSGKGKALLIAGQLPYKRVVGVEIDKELSCWAARNIDRARPRLRAGKVESLNVNILEWPIPDDTSVVFLYNPFIGQMFITVMSRIFDSYDHNPRPLHIIYEYPCEHDWLMSTGRVVVNDVRSSTSPGRFGWLEDGNVIVTYQVVNSVVPTQLKRRKSRRSGRALQRWSVPNGHIYTLPKLGPDEASARS
jgi:SAM-dependent methyltransferase